jgi:hypothetical protein
MHTSQSLPRRCTRATAVPCDVSGVPHVRSATGRAGRLAFALVFAVVFAATLFTAGRAFGQNLAPNGEFDTDVPPWGVGLGDSSVDWTELDHDGCEAAVSGAALATNSAANATQGRGISACITDFVPGQVYTFGADLRFPPGQARTGSALMKLVFLASTDCTGFSRTSVDTAPLDTSNTGSWVRLQGTGLPTEDDGSIALVARLIKNEAGGSLQLDVDGAFFLPGEGFIFADGFERQSTCHWSTTGS